MSNKNDPKQHFGSYSNENGALKDKSINTEVFKYWKSLDTEIGSPFNN